MNKDALERNFSIQTDIFAFGMFLYELGCKKPPFTDQDQARLVMARRKGEKVEPIIPPEIDRRYVEIMRECWNASKIYKEFLFH